ncbi:YhcN/YlaJ family sporulation lipoprotein [Anoxybacillus sp. J5B_2022]|uniref:YhcN/YlaJ family sporulation lipoprotein n=1 Tax=Anoxybacillus sp. J5B_2022 TaxID=3003246 RepID=UPI002286AE66|nr:YhcN/YlaJ family sporulation lipoprotein [Anoxybacillus sp. J5B_2022]MCZ0756170.1 YhcN/YlaJ family sporulation lipoprotein [Anoxybacillus sp. J5B_2022]
MMKQLIGIIIIGFVLLGCAREPGVQKQSLQGENMISLSTDGTARSHEESQSVAEQAVKQVKARNEIRDAVAVSTNRKLLLAYQVKQMDRFRMKQIAKDIQQQLELLFPDHDVTISSDLKLFWKTDELRGKIEKDHMSERKINQQINQLKRLSEERT